MSNRTRRITYLLVLLMTIIADWCGPMAYAGLRKHRPKRPRHDIVIYFDNDVHGAVEGYAKLSSLRQKTLRERTPYVTVVSCGDFSQGSHLCAFSHGRDIMTLLNMAGYEIVTLGNHEFDYGTDQVRYLAGLFHGETILCNFEDLRTRHTVFKPYTLKKYGKVTIGYVGVLNPSTEMTDAPESYFDENGNQIYSFNLFSVYERTQQAIDAAYREGADYVVVLSHLGENMGLRINSIDLIKNTHGVMAVLDGHAHHFNSGEWFPNAQGDSTLLMTMGSKFDYAGQLLLDTRGRLKYSTIEMRRLTDRDPDIVACIDSLEKAVSTTPPFGYSDFDLLGFDTYGVYDRNQETNLGDLCADAARITMGAQLAWVNSGGIRVSIKQGSFGIREVIDMYPFDNTLCISRVKGSVLRNALEYCMKSYPNDSGDFPQISGLRFTFDPEVPSAAIVDERGALTGISDGPMRVKSIFILNAQGIYEPIDMEGYYTIAATSFLLKNGGSGGIFTDSELLFDSGTMDTQTFEDYVTYNLNGRIPEAYRQPQGRILQEGQLQGSILPEEAGQ